MSVPSPRPELKAELRSATTLWFSSTQDHCIWRGFMNNCAPTLNSAAGMSGNNKPFVLTACLNFQGSKGNNVVSRDETCFTLNCMHGHDVHVVAQRRCQ